MTKLGLKQWSILQLFEKIIVHTLWHGKLAVVRCKIEMKVFIFSSEFYDFRIWTEVQVTQSYPTLCDPMDYTVHGILQARILDWVAVSFSRGSSCWEA